MKKIKKIKAIKNIKGGGGIGGRIYDYYVATTGSDSDAGTKEEPFLTLGQALSVITADQTVWVEAGTYSFGSINFSKGKWYSNGAKLLNNNEGAVFITFSTATTKALNGFEIDRNSTGSYVFSFASGCTTTSIDGCTISNSTTYMATAAAGTTGISFNGGTIDAGSNIILSYADDVTFNGCTINNIVGSGFYRYLQSGALTVTGCNLSMGSGYLAYARAAGQYTFTNNLITINGNISSLFNSDASTPKDVTFTGNTISTSGTYSSGLVRFPSGRFRNINVSNNTILCNSTIEVDPIIDVNVVGTVNVDNNTITHNVDSALSTSQIRITSAGTAINVSASENTIYAKNKAGYNIQIGTEGTGANDDTLTVVAEDNTIYGALYYDDTLTGVTAHGLFIGHNKDFDAKNNTFIMAGYGLALKHSGGSHNGEVSGNVSESCVFNTVKGLEDLVAFDNQFKAEYSFCSLLFSAVVEDGHGATGLDFQNNILYVGNGITLGGSWFTIDAASASGYTVDYNTVYGVSDDPHYFIGATDMNGWAAIQSGLSQTIEQNGQNTNPY